MVVAGVVVLMALSAGVSWQLFHGSDIDLGIALTGTTRRPLVVVGGKVEQMPSGDYLAANTLVDTSGCSSTNVIAWNGTQFACAAAGGGGGGITNSAPNRTLMMSDGTNAVSAPVTYASGTYLTYPGLWDLSQTVTNSYPIGEILRMTLNPGSGFTTGATGDIFAEVIRNQTLFDTTAGGNASGGAYLEVTSSKSAGSNQLINKALELKAANADLNYAIHVTGGDIISDTSGGLYVTAGPSQLTQTVTLGDLTHDVSVGHNLSLSNQLNITGTGSTLYAIQVTKGIISAGDINGASGFGVLRANGQNGQDTLQFGCPNDGGGHAKFWSLYMSGQDFRLYEYNQTANGSGGTATSGNDRVVFKGAGGGTQFLGNVGVASTGHLTAIGSSATLTNATCSSTTCTDVSGTITTAGTTATVTFATTYTGANDATCIILPQGTATMPVCTESATAITCSTVVNATKYNYQCIGHQ